jgi:hypothetical protein
MAVTYDSIATRTLTTASTTLSITSIPSSYTDLKAFFVWKSAGNASTNNIPVLTFNNNSTANYNSYYMSSGATSPTGGTLTGKNGYWTTGGSATANSTNWFCVEFDIMDYATSARLKLINSRLGMAQTGGANQEATVTTGQISNLLATITEIRIEDPIFGNNYAAGSTLSLFGIARA